MSNANIDFVVTENFWNNYSGTPSTKLGDCKSYCKSRWNNNVDNGNRSATFETHTGPSDRIPESALKDTGNFKDRSFLPAGQDMDYWLKNNWSDYTDSDCIVVLDWYDEDSSHTTYGQAYHNYAGDSEYITAAVNVWYEDNNDLPYEWQQEFSEGISWHEMAHVWDADHYNATNDFSSDMSLEWNWGIDMYCNTTSSTTDQITTLISDCNEDLIQSRYDNNI